MAKEHGSFASFNENTNSRTCRPIDMLLAYVVMTSIDSRMLDRELKKGSVELIILSIVEPRARHGYEISKLTETRIRTSRACLRLDDNPSRSRA